MHTKKWSRSSGPQRAPIARAQKIFIFPARFEDFVLLLPLVTHPSFAIRFHKKRKCLGFINVFDALIESMLDHRTVTPKSKNKPHAAWERSGAKRNERHAAWGRFSCFHGPVGRLKEGPPKMPQPVMLVTAFFHPSLLSHEQSDTYPL